MNPAVNAATIEITLPWLTMVLDQTDRVAAIIPEDKLDWRLADPSGKWHFSLAEIVMHCADARRLFARMLSGVDRPEDYLSTEPGEDGLWSFRPHGPKQAILEDLAAARAELLPWLRQPAAALMRVTDPAQAVWEKNLERMRQKGLDVSLDELRGPASILRILMACVIHEAGHRSSLQTLLRMHGVNLT